MTTHRSLLMTWHARNEQVAPLNEVRAAVRQLQAKSKLGYHEKALLRRLEKEVENPHPRFGA
ncbi:hypothetical protein LJY25_14635 [Hymenobacter sp. BT175]|uniref:hypothetical protein n=1 Tax=Hymenobacter translucens TaxID=2886507 RepID=UPI001D0E5914|nr:hypothetical protein [Hymenobacter translucens]MCC2547689.1 hypothetical protein [Hymenobacter translucens]